MKEFDWKGLIERVSLKGFDWKGLILKSPWLLPCLSFVVDCPTSYQHQNLILYNIRGRYGSLWFWFGLNFCVNLEISRFLWIVFSICNIFTLTFNHTSSNRQLLSYRTHVNARAPMFECVCVGVCMCVCIPGCLLMAVWVCACVRRVWLSVSIVLNIHKTKCWAYEFMNLVLAAWYWLREFEKRGINFFLFLAFIFQLICFS